MVHAVDHHEGQFSNMDDVLSTPRRAWMTGRGEHLLVPGTGAAPLHVQARNRQRAASDEWGLSPSDMLVSPLLGVPAPVYPPGGFADTRRWPGVRAEAMWHPLLWLPERVAQRYELEFPDGTTRVESDPEWLVRLGLEVESSGLYDHENGWVDVLAVFGLDIADPAVVERVKLWLDGLDDDVLDSIDLSDFTEDASDPDWALHGTQEILPDLIACSWTIAAEGLTEAALRLVTADRQTAKFESVHLALHALARVATRWFPEAPLTPDGLNIAKVARDSVGWADELAQTTKSVPELLDGPASGLLDAFDAVRSNPVLLESFENLGILSEEPEDD